MWKWPNWTTGDEDYDVWDEKLPDEINNRYNIEENIGELEDLQWKPLCETVW